MNQNKRWAIRISADDAWQLWSLREFVDVEVAFCEDKVWAMGAAELDDENALDRDSFSDRRADEAAIKLGNLLRSVSGAKRFHVGASGRLVPIGKRVPVGTLPDATWRPLVDCIELDVPVAGLAGLAPSPMRIEVIRAANRFANSSRQPEMLLCTLKLWSQFAESAPQIRLKSLSFACTESFENGEAHVLIRGKPLPPIPGQRLIQIDRVAVPVGYSWRPSVSPKTILSAFQVPENSILVLFPGDRWNLVSTDLFVVANRSAVRTTASKVVDNG